MLTLTARMSDADAGVFNRLVDNLYLYGRALPDDDKRIAALLRLDVRKWRPIRKRFLAVNAIVIIDGCIDEPGAMSARSARHRTHIALTSAGHRGGIASGKTRKAKGLHEANLNGGLKQEESRGEERESLKALPLMLSMLNRMTPTYLTLRISPTMKSRSDARP
jgi:hypothetical protein